MLDATNRSVRLARTFAEENGLAFAAKQGPALPAIPTLHPFTSVNQEPRSVVSGQWRGAPVQRMVLGNYDVQIMELPQALPRLQLLPATADWATAHAVGVHAVTGDASFDFAWRAMAADDNYAREFLSPQIRQALMHEAAAGKAITIDGTLLYVWSPASESSAKDLRVRFEFLSVVAGRIEAAVWARWSLGSPAPVAAPVASAQPEAARVEEPQYARSEYAMSANRAASFEPAYAGGGVPRAAFLPEPLEELPAEDRALNNTGELDVAMLNAKLNGSYLPDPNPASNQGWIGGDEVDQSSMFFTGARLKGQARPRV